jgi:hypothetical protein
MFEIGPSSRKPILYKAIFSFLTAVFLRCTQNGIPGFSFHFPKELGYGYLMFEGDEKISLGR